MTSPLSVRFDRTVLARLRQHAGAVPGATPSALVQRLGVDAPGAKAIFYGLTLMVIISLQPNGVWPWLARRLRLDRPAE